MLASNDEWERERNIMLENIEKLIHEFWYSKGSREYLRLEEGRFDHMGFYQSLSKKDQKFTDKLIRKLDRLERMKPGSELKPKRTKREKTMNINTNNTMDLNFSENIKGNFEWYGDENDNDNGCWIAGNEKGFWLASNNSLTGDEIIMLIEGFVEKESRKLELAKE